MKIAAIVQARTSSERLPRKILYKLPYESKITVLEQVIRRLKRAKEFSNIIIASSTNKNDLPILTLAKKEKVIHFRGPEKNVLKRYYLAAKKNNIDVIVRITADCPCIDPEIVDLVVRKHLKEKNDFTANCLERTYPRGMDVEVLNFSALKKAYIFARSNFDKEHVCPYIMKNKSKTFKIKNIVAPKKYNHPEVRITLDTKEDYILLCAIFDELYDNNNFFSALDIIKLINKKPWLKLINEEVKQKN